MKFRGALRAPNHSSWGAQASNTSDEEVFCTHTNLTGLLITKLGNFSFGVQQKQRMLSYETHQSFRAIQI